MELLIFYISLSIGVSFMCSMLEAVILSVTPSYLISLKKKKPELYQQVKGFKDDIEKPLASILTFNTIAHTIGAAGAGAEAQRLFGSQILAIFSAALTFGILFFSEIIPKSIGASSWKLLLPLSAKILRPMVFVSYPLVWLSEKVSRLFKSKISTISRDEISAIADIGLKDGAIDNQEYKSLKGLIKFSNINLKDVYTPVEEVKTLNLKSSVEEAYQEVSKSNYSRFPVYFQSKNNIKGYILRSVIQKAIIDKSQVKLKKLIKPILILPDTTNVNIIFQRLLKRNEHICAIIDSMGNFIGIITLEDIIEHMLDLEIFDEFDSQR